MAAKALPKVSLVGAGRVGSALARGLAAEGYRIVSIISRSGKSGLALARSVKCKKVSTVPADIDPSTEIILIAVPDAALDRVAADIARVKGLPFGKLIVMHTSGALSSEHLKPLAAKGASTASFHPMQTFPARNRSVKLQGIAFGVEGTERALARAELMARALGASTVTIDPALKPLYHIACVFSSGYLVILLKTIQELAVALKIPRPWTGVFGPLMTSAMQNTIRTSPADALTGPAARGDIATVELHLRALQERAPHLLPLYTVAGIESARTAFERGTFGRETFEEFVTVFKSFISSLPTQHQRKGRS